MKNIYFSAGSLCATAHQIRRITDHREAYFFDWLVTRDTSFAFLLMDDEGFLGKDNWEIIDNGMRLFDRYSGLAFQHEFKAVDQIIDPALVDEHLEVAQQKFVYLKKKLIAALKQAQRPVVIRCRNPIKTLSEAKQELDHLRKVFFEINQNINFVLASTQLEEEEINPRYLIVKVKVSTLGRTETWKGDNDSWDRLIQLAEDHLIFQ